MSETFTTYGIGPDKQFDELQTLRDERDRLRDELDVYRQAVQYVFEAINKFENIQRKKAALTPAGEGRMSNDVVCMFCRKGPMDGVTVHRINEKGVDGIWACNTHIKQTDVVVDPEVKALTDILDGTTK